MKLFKVNVIRSVKSLSLKSGETLNNFAKISICLVALFLHPLGLFSQAPKLEHRVVNLRYEPIWPPAPNGAIVFDLQLRAGENYLATGYPMLSTDIYMSYDFEAGVTIGPVGWGTLPSPNPHYIMNITANNWAWPPPGITGIRLRIEKNISIINPQLYNFTYEFATVATINLPVVTGTPTLASSMKFVEYDGTPFTTGWGSGLNPGIGYGYEVACPSESHIGVNSHAMFDFDINYCINAPGLQLPTLSNNGITGIWTPDAIVTSTAGEASYIFTPDDDQICEYKAIVTVHSPYAIEVQDIDICGGIPFDLIEGVVVNPTIEDTVNYKFYTCEICDGSDFVEVEDPLDVVITKAGDFTYYARYITGCSSLYEPFTVTVDAPAEAVVDMTCTPLGTMTYLEIISPIGDYTYSIDGDSYQPEPFFEETALGDMDYTVYIMDNATGCFSTNFVTCDPCPSEDNLTLAGSGNICISGTKTVEVTFSKTDSVVVEITSGAGELSTDKITTSGSTVTYTPASDDIGNTVTLTFTIPEQEDCTNGDVIKYVTFTVNGLPTVAVKDSMICSSNPSEDFDLEDLVTAYSDAVQVYKGASWIFIEDAGLETVTANSIPVVIPVRAYNTATGCYSDPAETIILRVSENPILTIIEEEDIVCYHKDSTFVLTGMATTTSLGAEVEVEIDGEWISIDGAEQPVALGNTVKVPVRAYNSATTCHSIPVDTITLTVNANPILTHRDAIICYHSDSTFVLTNMATTTDPEAEVYVEIGGSWELIGGVTQHVTLGSTVKVPVYALNATTLCVSPVDTIILTVNETPIVTILPPAFDEFNCSNEKENLVLSTTSPNCTDCAYLWSGGTAPLNASSVIITAEDVEPDLGTTFTVTITNSQTRCNSTDNITIMRIRCNLLDCNAMIDRIEDEDFYQACQFTLTTTEWDIAQEFMDELDSAQYFVDGELYSNGTSATLLDYVFPIGISEVMVIGYRDQYIDTCEFTVTVERFCPAEIFDEQGNRYDVSKVAGLCWTSNLKATKYADGTFIEWANPYHSTLYPDDEANADIFGLLYTWQSAVGVPEGSTELPAPDANNHIQGICPEGWHIPSQAEWELLENFSAADLMSVDYWVNAQGTNATGFDARPAGWFNGVTNRYEDMYGFAGWWASDAAPHAQAYHFYLTYYCELIREDVIGKTNGLSVRCVLDSKCSK